MINLLVYRIVCAGWGTRCGGSVARMAALALEVCNRQEYRRQITENSLIVSTEYEGTGIREPQNAGC